MKKLLMMLAAVALLGGAASPADAAFRLRFDLGNNGTYEVTVTDGGMGDSNPAAGVITYLDPLGAFTVNVTTGVSKPAFTGAPKIDLNSVVVTTATAGVLAIELTDTDFTGVNLPLQFSVGGTTGGTVAFTGAGGVSNNEFDFSNGVSPTLATVGSAFAGAVTFGPTTANPFSLSIRAVITHTGPASTSFDAELAAVPAPAGLLLVGAAAPLLGAGAWLRRRKVAA